MVHWGTLRAVQSMGPRLTARKSTAYDEGSDFFSSFGELE
jgi:hypothetical protein